MLKEITFSACDFVAIGLPGVDSFCIENLHSQLSSITCSKNHEASGDNVRILLQFAKDFCPPPSELRLLK